MSNLLSEMYRMQLALEAAKSARRKCFVSYYSKDKNEVDKFIKQYGDVFIPKVIGVTDKDDFINSENSNYVMSKIREKYLGDSTVTILLIGLCTHSRRYIDWELKTTLRRGEYTPNGLLGILLPSMGNSGQLPPRFKENWEKDESKGYAIYRSYPSSGQQLKNWIEGAYARRTSHANLIKNSQAMHKYNHKCIVHNVTH
jgi:hypothetical protein